MLSTEFESAKREIAYAFERVPFFKQHMDAAGLVPGDLRAPADLLRLPPTRKQHYRSNFPAGVLAAGHGLDEPLVFRSQSSGTEGDRLITVTHSYRLTERLQGCLEFNPRFQFMGATRNLRSCRYAAPNCSDVECANPNTTMRDRILPDGTLVLPVYADLLTTPEKMVSVAIQEVRGYRPQLLYVDPTHLAFLTRQMQTRTVAPPSAQGIVATYTLCTAIARQQIEAFFGPATPLARVHSMSEFGWLGMECTAGRLHLNRKSFYFELLRPDGRHAVEGETGELVVTSLGDELSPHIRYQTGDHFTWLEGRCACGSPAPAVACEGRAVNMLARHERAPLTPRQLDDVVGAPGWLELYQLEQLSLERSVLRVVGTDDPAGLEALRQRVEGALGSTVEVQRTRYIPAERSGKFLSCKSRLSLSAPVAP